MIDIDPVVAFIVVVLVVSVSAVLLWLAEWKPGDKKQIPPTQTAITPQDWDRR